MKISKLVISLMALGMLSGSAVSVVPQVASAKARRPKITKMTRNHLQYKLGNPNYRHQLIRRNRQEQHYLSDAYDISQYQGYITNSMARRLKHEVHFMILRAQGGQARDYSFSHNRDVLDQYHIPYGVYSYSYYWSVASAKAEARALYEKAPHAAFYANDIEQNDAGYNYNLNAATKAWAQEMHKLTNKPIVLYSGEYFMNSHFYASTRNYYNAIWLAAYGAEPMPGYSYDLWQSFDNFYSPALGQRIDADVFPAGSTKPLSFWTGGKTAKSIHHHAKVIRVNPAKPAKQNRVIYKAIKKLNNQANRVRVTKHQTRRHLNNDKANITTELQQMNVLEKKYKRLPRHAKVMLLNTSTSLVNKLNYANRILAARKKGARKHKANPANILAKRIHANAKPSKRAKRIRRGFIAKHNNHVRRYVKRSRKPRIRRNKMSWYHNYYSSHRIHTLKVRTHSLRMYNYYNFNYWSYLPRGTKIRHVHFYKTIWHGHVISRAVGECRGIMVDTSAKKDCVRPVK